LPAARRSSITKGTAAALAEQYELPHEWLLRVARGERIRQRRLVVTFDPQSGVETDRKWVEEDWYATFEQRMAAAKECAPFYAPKLAAHTIQPAANDIDALRELFAALAERLPG
jgi:hypothetical protein